MERRWRAPRLVVVCIGTVSALVPQQTTTTTNFVPYERLVDRSRQLETNDFEFTDLLSYSYDLGESGEGDTATDAGGFGKSFTLGDVNFGPVSDANIDNSGRGDGSFVDGVQIKGNIFNSLLGISVASAGDFNGDGIDDIVVGARGARRVYVFFGLSDYQNFRERRRRMAEQGDFDYTVDEMPAGSVLTIIDDSADTDSGFGELVAAAGDMNGDGYDDIAVSAPSAKSDRGRVYVFYGGPDVCCDTMTIKAKMPKGKGFIIQGDSPGDILGSAIAGGFDFDGDENDDLLIGVSGFNDNLGAAVLVYGQTYEFSTFQEFGHLAQQGGKVNPRGLLMTLDDEETARSSFDGKAVGLGIAVHAADDVNGDGYDDIVIGADRYNRNGAAFVVFGSESKIAGKLDLDALDGSDGFAMYGLNKGDAFGAAVSKAGDFNGDGYGDVIIGALGVKHRAGAAYIVYGKSSFGPNATADVALAGPQENGFTGFSVATAGDIDGDGLDDVLIGAVTASPNGLALSGAVFAVLGGGNRPSSLDLADLDGFDGFLMRGTEAGDLAGFAIGPAGDFNNDGIDDICIGAARSSAHVPFSGVSYILFGTEFTKPPTTQPTGPSQAPTPAPLSLTTTNGVLPFPATFSSSEIAIKNGAYVQGETSMNSTAFPGDVDGDSIDDVVAAADGYAYVIYGVGSDGFWIKNISGPLANLVEDEFPGDAVRYYANGAPISVVAGAGDVNDDGYDDVAFGAPTAYGGVGTVFVIFGSDTRATGTVDIMNDFTKGVDYMELMGMSTDGFGSALSSTDLNGDGYADVVVGAPYAVGSAYAVVYFGSATASMMTVDVGMLNATDGVVIFYDVDEEDANTSSSMFGYAVAGIGDMNGDGIDDVAVGAPGWDAVCVVLGAETFAAASFACTALDPTSTAISGLTIVSAYEGGGFGASLAHAGDVNDDGFADFLIGAPLEMSEAGAAYLILGQNVLSTPVAPLDVGMKFYSSVVGDSLGSSVAGAGDINNDALHDMMIGADGILWDGTTSSKSGTVFIIYGSMTSFVMNMSVDIRDWDNDGGGFAITGSTPGSGLGAAVHIGNFDINNDGVDDLIVTEPGTKTSYILFGMDEDPTPSFSTSAPTTSPAPTVMPSPVPSPMPSISPVPSISPAPSTAMPSACPTMSPAPTTSPAPTAARVPTVTTAPTATFTPTMFPTVTPGPSKGPTNPTMAPTISPKPSTRPTAQPSTEPTSSTKAPTSLSERFAGASVGWVETQLRIEGMDASDLGSAEITTVQFAVFDVLGDQGGDGVIDATDDVMRVTATTVASIDLSFFAEITPPSAFASSTQDLVTRVSGAMATSVTDGELSERLLYWAQYFGANEAIAGINTTVTLEMLDDADINDVYFSLPPTMAPTPAPDSSSKKSSSSSGLSGGAIAGIVIAAVVVLFCCIGAFWFWRQRQDDDSEYRKPKALPVDDDDDDAPVQDEGAITETGTAVDETGVSLHDELAVVDPPAADTGHQDKIIEADL